MQFRARAGAAGAAGAAGVAGAAGAAAARTRAWTLWARKYGNKFHRPVPWLQKWRPSVALALFGLQGRRVTAAILSSIDLFSR
ncbi:hypothetical protein EBZ80_16960 [bacterium]|nr:hypothetical protein [bacterium]